MNSDKFPLFSLFMIWFSVILSCGMTAAQGCPEEPGCHLVGYSNTFRPLNCQPFDFVGNACCGYCNSSTETQTPKSITGNESQKVISISQCCDMDRYVNVSVWVHCADGRKEFILHSAESCKCSHCHREIN